MSAYKKKNFSSQPCSLWKVVPLKIQLILSDPWWCEYLLAVYQKYVRFSWIWEKKNYWVPHEKGYNLKEGTEKLRYQSSAWNTDFLLINLQMNLWLPNVSEHNVRNKSYIFTSLFENVLIEVVKKKMEFLAVQLHVQKQNLL